MSETGLHSIYYTLIDTNNCTRTDSFKVRVNTIVDASIDSVGAFCLNNRPQALTAKNSTNGFFTKTLFLDSAGIFIPNAAGGGTHKIFYNSRSDKGCIATDSIEIKVNDLPDASIAIKNNYCQNSQGEKLTGAVHTNGTFDVTPYLMSTGHLDLFKANLGDQNVFYTVIDANGCSNSDSAVLKVDSIPNSSILPAGPYCQSSLAEQLLTENSGVLPQQIM